MGGRRGEVSKLSRTRRSALRELLIAATADDPNRVADVIDDAPVALLPDVAAAHRVTGAVTKTLSAIDNVPECVTTALDAATAINSLRHLVHVGVLGELAATLDGAGLRWLVMKGPVLAGHYYDDAGERGYGDLDLLVDHRDFPRAVEVLERSGFRHKIRNWPLAEEMLAGQVEMRRGPVSVDLHWHLHYGRDDRRPYGFRPSRMIDRSRRVGVSGLSVPTFGPIDTIVTLAFHAARSGGHALVWCVDLQRVLAAEDPDYEQVMRVSLDTGCGPSVGLMLGRARDLIGAPVPYEVMDRLVPRPLATAVEAATCVSHPVEIGRHSSVNRFVMRSARPTAFQTAVEIPIRASRQLLRIVRPPREHETDDPSEKASYLRAVAAAWDG